MGDTKSVIRRIVEAEPAVIRGGVASVVGVAATLFNIHFASGTVENVDMVIISVFALIASFWTRGSVVPVSKVEPMGTVTPALTVASSRTADVQESIGGGDSA